MVQNCLRAHTLLAKLGIDVTVADARFCKPLDIKLVRRLCKNHRFLITVEEGSVGGFGAHVAQFISLDGLLDAGIKVTLISRMSLKLDEFICSFPFSPFMRVNLPDCLII